MNTRGCWLKKGVIARPGRWHRAVAGVAGVVGVLISGPAWGVNAINGNNNGNDSEVTNPISMFEIMVDGLFSGGVSGGQINGEWSDVTPLGFVGPPSDDPSLPLGGLRRTGVFDGGDTGIMPNSLKYVAVAPGNDVPDGIPEDLYLLYDYLPRTNPVFRAGEIIAEVTFPVMLDSDETLIRVLLRGADPGARPVLMDADGDGMGDPVPGSFFDVFVYVGTDTTQTNMIDPSRLGINAAVGFGPTALSQTVHMTWELEAALLIPAGFFDDDPGLPAGGLPGVDGNGYSPDPAFWRASSKNDREDPISAAVDVQINSNGSVTADSSQVPPAVPEPVGAVLGLMGVGALGVSVRWRRAT